MNCRAGSARGSQRPGSSLSLLGFKFVTLDLEGFRSGSLNGLIPLDSLLKPVSSRR